MHTHFDPKQQILSSGDVNMKHLVMFPSSFYFNFEQFFKKCSKGKKEEEMCLRRVSISWFGANQPDYTITSDVDVMAVVNRK